MISPMLYRHSLHGSRARPVSTSNTKPLTGYGPSGERLVAGIVPLSADSNHVLLISSTRRSTWVLPKGGWETDEATQSVAAQREAWEEAGIVLRNLKDLGAIDDKRNPAQLTADAPKATYHFFEAVVDRTEAEWPEMKKRERRWMTYRQAYEALKDRPELLEALSRSGVNKAV